MPVVIPQERRLILPEDGDGDYSIPINVLHSQRLEMGDELLLHEMARYKPDTRLREGDFVLLMARPPWMTAPVVPRTWKVRFVVTLWAWQLMKAATECGGAISLDEAVWLLETASKQTSQRANKAMIFATSYPIGKYPKTVQWLPEQLTRRTTFREPTQNWNEIINELGADYRGYEVDDDRNFVLDLEPNDYNLGKSLDRPLRAEEAMTHDLYLAGLEDWIEFPYEANEPDRLAPLDPEHDIFAKEESP